MCVHAGDSSTDADVFSVNCRYPVENIYLSVQRAVRKRVATLTADNGGIYNVRTKEGGMSEAFTQGQAHIMTAYHSNLPLGIFHLCLRSVRMTANYLTLLHLSFFSWPSSMI